MGSATIRGQLWGARAQDWATYVEQVCLPLFGATLDAARVTVGTRLLDAGCGAGLLALLASFRGAQVTALDASPGLLAMARQRLPGADVREGDLEALPFADASFDAVGAVTASSTRRIWRPPCASSSASPGASPPHPGALSEPGALAGVLEGAGLRVVDEGEVACPFVFPSTEASWRGNSAAGVAQAAIAHSGEAAVRAVYANADRAHMRPDGSVRYDNVFLWAAGERP